MHLDRDLAWAGGGLDLGADARCGISARSNVSLDSQVQTKAWKNLRVAVRRAQASNLGDSSGGGSKQKIADILDASLGVGVQVGDHGEEDVVE